MPWHARRRPAFLKATAGCCTSPSPPGHIPELLRPDRGPDTTPRRSCGFLQGVFNKWAREVLRCAVSFLLRAAAETSSILSKSVPQRIRARHIHARIGGRRRFSPLSRIYRPSARHRPCSSEQAPLTLVFILASVDGLGPLGDVDQLEPLESDHEV